MKLVLLGPPGSGKGTQARRLASHFGIPHISTGELFRSHVAAGSALGMTAEHYLSRGALVPDEITNEVVKCRLAEADTVPGFLLDGYPRTLPQVEVLDAYLAQGIGGRPGAPLRGVILIEADADALTQRLLARAQQENRPDDTEEIIRHRLEIYQETTAPIADVYRHRGLLVAVDGMADIDTVTQRILDSLTVVV